MMTDAAEFYCFHKLLTANAPSDNQPFYIPLLRNTKEPDGGTIESRAGAACSNCGGDWYAGTHRFCKKCDLWGWSWHCQHARMGYAEAHEWIKAGNNVGLVTIYDDELVVVDDDRGVLLNQLPTTLTARSRSRRGFHFYFHTNDERLKTLIAISTADFKGEIRGAGCYIVCPGSYVPADNNGTDPAAGHYTLERCQLPTRLTWEQLPDVVKTTQKNCSHTIKINHQNYPESPLIKKIKNKICMTDLAKYYGVTIKGRKAKCPFHEDNTPSMSINDAEGLWFCHGCRRGGGLIGFVKEMQRLRGDAR